MPRIPSSQPATSRSKTVSVEGVNDDWQTFFEAPDYSVPDPTLRWPDERDPEDANRRIQPGQVIITTPLFIYNAHPELDAVVEVRVLTQDGEGGVQAHVRVPPRETYLHPCAGVTLVKDNPAAQFGDRLQLRDVTGAENLHVTFSVAVGVADQDQPNREVTA